VLFRFAIVRSSRTEELEVSNEVGVEGLHILQLWLDTANFYTLVSFLDKSNFQKVDSGDSEAVF
jgi:hypothetical protein